MASAFAMNTPRWRKRRGRRRPATKVAFGVIVAQVSATTGRPEAILVRGRYTDSFAEFVYGRYSRKNPATVAALLDRMSVQERLDVMSLNFEQMWFRIWLTRERGEHYNKKFAKFYSAWLRDDSGLALTALVRRSAPLSGNAGARLEFPKGRRRIPAEPDLNAAIRETEEEAGVVKRDYQLIPDYRRVVSYVHKGVRYINIYYVGVARRSLRLTINFRNISQVAEISDVRWMDIEQIRAQDGPDRRLERTVAPVFNRVRSFVKGRAPVRNPAFRIVRGGAPPVPRDTLARLDEIAAARSAGAAAASAAESARRPKPKKRRRRRRKKKKN